MTEFEKTLELIKRGEYEKGLKNLDRLEEVPELRVLVLGTRAWLLRSLGRYEDAYRDYTAMTRETPDDAEVLALLAETSQLMGKYEQALNEATAALQVNPRNVRAAKVVVGCQEALGIVEVPEAAPPFERPTVPPAPINPVIETLEKDPASFPTSIFPEIGRLLYAFVRALRPALVVETGSFVGYSALCIAQALEENGGGHLHCFDLFAECPKDYVSPVLGPRTSLLEVARGHLLKAGLAHRVSLHPGDSSTSIRAQFPDATQVVDLAFIDGDHTIEGCAMDWRAVDAILKPGGIVFFHDTIPKECGWLGPRHLLEGLDHDCATDYPWINIKALEGIGFAVLQKRTRTSSSFWRPSLWDLLVDKLMFDKFLRDRAKKKS